MFPGSDILARKFEGFTDADIIAEVNKVTIAANTVLVQRDSQLTLKDIEIFPPAPPIEELLGDPVPTEPQADPDLEVVLGDDLPPGFPSLKILAAAGITTRAQLKEISNESLAQISGIGSAALGKIRDAEVALLTQ